MWNSKGKEKPPLAKEQLYTKVETDVKKNKTTWSGLRLSNLANEESEEPPAEEQPANVMTGPWPPTPGNDPRFQQTNQAKRCYVMYTDYYRCLHILGEEHEACPWFKFVFNAICPTSWVERWDEMRKDGHLPWHRRYQGKFPGESYG